MRPSCLARGPRLARAPAVAGQKGRLALAVEQRERQVVEAAERKERLAMAAGASPGPVTTARMQYQAVGALPELAHYTGKVDGL